MFCVFCNFLYTPNYKRSGRIGQTGVGVIFVVDQSIFIDPEYICQRPLCYRFAHAVREIPDKTDLHRRTG